jgi:hypothetical protein
VSKRGDFVVIGLSELQAVALHTLLTILSQVPQIWSRIKGRERRALESIRSKLKKKIMKARKLGPGIW